MFEAAERDVALQQALIQAIIDDPLFFFNGFCWLYEPRPRPQTLPFITWPHQDPAIMTMAEVMGRCDVGLDKSRGEGATWIYLMLALRAWLTEPLFTAGLVTRNEKLVDSRDESDSLMWKLDWELLKLPRWLRPSNYDPQVHRSYSNHTMLNPQNRAVISGFAGGPDIGRGGRKTVFFMDEFAAFLPGTDYESLSATQHNTESRFLVSTYRGDTGAYYIEMNDENNSMVRVVLDWKDNPSRNRHMYTVTNGVPVFDDEKDQNNAELVEITKKRLKRLESRGFAIEGTRRSPWYDKQCLRPGATPRKIARELDRNPAGTVSKIFDAQILKRAIDTVCRDPDFVGSLVWDSETARPRGVLETQNGNLSLWFRPGIDGSPPAGRYIVACDIAVGTHGDFSSNSVACVLNADTGEQVAEAVLRGVSALRFGRYAVALSRWFHGAYLNWEANGAGKSFSEEVVDQIGYDNVYMRDVGIEGLHTKTKKPGFWNKSEEVKLHLFEIMCMSVGDGEFTPRSKAMIGECRQYEWKNGRIVFVQSSKTQEGESTAGEFSHGDRVIAAAIAWKTRQEYGPKPSEEKEDSSHNFDAEDPARIGGKVDPWTGEKQDFGIDSGFSYDSTLGVPTRDPWL